MENEFINAPLLVGRPAVDPKDELIKGLELKNSKLKTELLKIQRTMEERFEGETEQEGPKKRESIFQWEESLEVLTKELANSYKKIKMYEYEIGKLENNGNKGGSSVTQKSTQIELIIKEKHAMAEKLKQQLAKQQKITQDNSRRLGNNNQREEMELQTRKLAEEAKFYKEKVRFLEQAEALKAGNMKKQHEAIKKFENELLQAGVAGGELEELRNRAIRSVNARKAGISESRANQDEEVNASHHTEEEEVEDRTREHYDALLGEVALFQKMVTDHQRQFAQAEEEKQEAIRKNLTSRNKLLECENEIENLEKEIAIMKGRVIPSNMKPLNPIRSLSSHQGENPGKVFPAKPVLKNKGLNHLLKFDQVGLPSPKGQRFSDRIILGKANLFAKITGIKVFIERISGLFGGVQATYDGKRGGEHVRRDREAKEKQYNEEEFVCRGHAALRTISGTLSPDDKLESLLVTSSDGNSQKFGTAKTTQKHFSFQIGSEEFPTCIFGTLLVVKEAGKREYSILEHLGFQIQNQNGHSTSAVLNEFNE